MSRKMYRNVEKRGAHTARNGASPPPTPAGGPVAKPEISTADRLGSRKGSSRGGWRELLTPWGDERDRSLSHRGAVSFKIRMVSPELPGRSVKGPNGVPGTSCTSKCRRTEDRRGWRRTPKCRVRFTVKSGKRTHSSQSRGQTDDQILPGCGFPYPKVPGAEDQRG